MRAPLILLPALFAALPALAEVNLASTDLHNPTAYIPPQCYTETRDAAGTVHNPCMTCHVRPRAPNAINDEDLQRAFALPGPARTNRWTNLFVDRRPAIAATDAAEIDAYVRQDNYRDADGAITLARVLAEIPAGWDVNGDGQWNGYIPDAFFDFDAQGHDRAPDGTPTGWRAFAYVPLPGGFWPANGATDDVLIRLPAIFRQTEAGASSLDAYALNLAIVEALILRADVAIDPVDESLWGVDLDGDGHLGTAERVAFDWAPLEGRMMSWVGAARRQAPHPPTAGLFPLGTEFLHSVRYLDVTDDGIALAPRLRELRYAVKTRWLTYADFEEAGLAEAKERADFPDRISLFFGSVETGIANGAGWRYQGFIEDALGALRPQSFEETVFCVGCHGGIGVTDNSAFAFPRILPADRARARGWYHGSQQGLAGIPDPMRADGRAEILTYLRENGAGDEFRSNDELIARAFETDGSVAPDFAAALAGDIAVALFPSPGRARALNTAYREIVREQSFILGRDPVLAPAVNVHRQVDPDEPTGVETPVPAARW